jgi:hypothetical protein
MEHRGGGALFLAAAVAELVALAVFIVALRAPNRGKVNAG